jgi:hypothetical protein
MLQLSIILFFCIRFVKYIICYIPSSVIAQTLPRAVWATLPKMTLFTIYIVLFFFSINIYDERIPHQGVSRTVFSKAAPPVPCPRCLATSRCRMDYTSKIWDNRHLVSQDTTFVHSVHMFNRVIYLSCINLLYLFAIVMLYNNHIYPLSTNFNFSGLYMTCIFSSYNVVSVFSNAFALALSNIIIHQYNKLYNLIFHYHQLYCHYGQLAEPTEGTGYVWRWGIRHCPGHVICRVSPNGD